MMEVDGQNQYSDIDAPWRDEETLYHLYVEQGLGTPTIGKILGCSTTTAWEWVKKAGIETRSPPPERTPYYGQNTRGYMVWTTSLDGTHHSVYVHRLLAVAEYGLDAVSDKSVHHKNGVPWDNRPENIELLTASDHAKLHAAQRKERRR